MIRWIFLDLDDTILDFGQAEDEAIRKTFSFLGIPPTDETVARYSAINKAQWEALERGELTREEVQVRRFEILFRELGSAASPEEARDYYMLALSREHGFMPFGKKLLDALYGRYKLYIASNGTLFNQKFHPSALSGMEGLNKFVALVRGFFYQKGMHVQ